RQYVLPDRTDLTARITRDEFIDLLTDPHRAIVADRLAQRLELQKDSSFEVLIGDRRDRYVAGAILADQGVARAFSGPVLVLDIAAATTALGKPGALDRIDIQLRNHNDVDAVRDRIAKLLPSTAMVDDPEAGALQNEKLSHAFRYNLT